MNASSELQINDDHPLALELTSLRQAVCRFQHEAHSSSLKLQRHVLESSYALERATILERENSMIRQEIANLRTNSDATSHSAAHQVSELTLALRRISEKLTLTEETLLTRTTELTRCSTELKRTKHDVESAHALAASCRGREEECAARERDLLYRNHALEEEHILSEKTMRDYANLVRSLERQKELTGNSTDSRQSSSSLPLDDSNSSILELQGLLEKQRMETKRLESENLRLKGLLESCEHELDVERQATEKDQAVLARLQTELDKVNVDDKAATKMVSRYMKFSQTTIDTLHSTLDKTKARHAATVATLEHQLSALRSTLDAERRQSDRLRNALDELTEDLARESYGRRREITLRLAVIGREDGLAEALRRWVRRAKEIFLRVTPEAASNVLRDCFANVLEDAETLLRIVNGDDGLSNLDDLGVGGIARILAAQDAVKTLVEELQGETEKRVRLERLIARSEFDENDEIISPPLPTSISDLHFTDEPSASVGVTTPPIPTSATATIATSRRSRTSSGSVGSQQESPPSHLNLSGHEPASSASQNARLSFTTPLQPSPRQVRSSPAFVSDVDPIHSPDGGAASPTSEETTPSPLQDSTETNMDEPSSVSPPEPDAQPLNTHAFQHSTSSPQLSPTEMLLEQLMSTKSRYDVYQRAFRNCHLTLRDLTHSLPELFPLHSTTHTLLITAAERLHDFGEDTRVELEIRVADEERIRHGYHTLLFVRGALGRESDARTVVEAVQAFVDGTDPGVARALSRFQRKLDDFEHDVAALKRAVHAQPTEDNGSPTAQEEEARTTSDGQNSATWTSFAAGFFTSSRPSSPAPPSFGSLMVSPQLKRPPSNARLRTTEEPPRATPFTALGLRLPMPEHVPSLAPAGLETPRTAPPRARATSGIYMLGLGMRSTASFVPTTLTSSTPRTPLPGSRKQSIVGLGLNAEKWTDSPSASIVDGELSTADVGDSDVE